MLQVFEIFAEKSTNCWKTLSKFQVIFQELKQVWPDLSHLAVGGSGRTGHRGRTRLSLTTKNFKPVKQFQRTNFPNFIKVKCFRGGSQKSKPVPNKTFILIFRTVKVWLRGIFCNNGVLGLSNYLCFHFKPFTIFFRPLNCLKRPTHFYKSISSSQSRHFFMASSKNMNSFV